MITFLKLIRWKNLLIVAATMFAMKYAIILPIYTYFNIPVALSQGGFVLLVLSVILLFSAGNVINDYFDRKADMINRPGEVIVVFSIRRRKAIFIHMAFSILGIILGFIVSYIIGKTVLGLFFILAAIILWLYSASFKKKAFIGDITASLLTAMVPLVVGIFEYFAFTKYNADMNIMKINYMASYVILGFSIFAFLYSFILRIVKDCANYEGDKETGVKTVAVQIGKKSTNYILGSMSLIATISAIIAVYVFLPKIFFFENDLISIWYVNIFIVVPSLALTISSFIGTQKRKYIQLIRITKIIMFFGILFSFVFSFVVYGFI